MMPAVFVTDFGPFPAVETDEYTAALGRLGKMLPHPESILIMSGHWQAQGTLAVTGAETPGILHDYSGFPEEFYRLHYQCPGNPRLAKETAGLLSSHGFAAKVDGHRALDHGAWVPLSRLYPDAGIPVIQLTVPREPEKRKIFEVGRILSVLRERGVLLIGAGALSHNLRLALVHAKDDPPEDWALQFDAWLSGRLEGGPLEDLFNFQTLAPFARLAAPTTEHFDPLFFVLGAGNGERPESLHQSIRYANGIMRIFALGLPEGLSNFRPSKAPG